MLVTCPILSPASLSLDPSLHLSVLSLPLSFLFSNMDAAKIVELAAKSGIAAADAEALVSFALGYADGARNADSTEPVHLFGAAVSANVTPIWAFLVATGIP